MSTAKGRKKPRQVFDRSGWVDDRLPEDIDWMLPAELKDRAAFKVWLGEQVGRYRAMSSFYDQEPPRAEMLQVLADFSDCLEGVLHFTGVGGLPPSLDALLNERAYKHMKTLLRDSIDRNHMLKIKLFVEDVAREVAGWKQPPGVKRNAHRDKLFMDVTWRMWKDTDMELSMVAVGKMTARMLEGCGITGLPQEDATVKRRLRTLMDEYWLQ